MKLGLDTVLLDPKTGQIYTPNTDKTSVMSAASGLTNDEVRAILESRGRHYIKGEHGYFMGSYSDGMPGGGSSGGAAGDGTENHTLSEDVELDSVGENSSKPITPITDSAIEKVPMVSIAGYSDEQCAEIQRQHQELLKYSRDNNESKEVAFVFSNSIDISGRKEFIGSDDELKLNFDSFSGDVFVMHNHLRNSSYSFTDVVEFVGYERMKSLSIVKNNGKVEVLTKTSAYDRGAFLTELKRACNNEIKTGSDAEYRKIVDKFLKKYAERGIFEWKK